MKLILNFLKELSKNNNRQWFNLNKDKYENARNEFEKFVIDLVKEIGKFDKNILNKDPRKFIFRLHRDVRFSKDKSPYKLNFGAHIHSGDKLTEFVNAGYYVHIEPKKNFIAGGAYMPPSSWLQGIRNRIAEEGELFHNIVTNKEFKKYFLLEGDKLKKPPKGFSVDHKYIEYIKMKYFIGIQKLNDSNILDKNFLNNTVKAFKALKEFDEFLNDSKK